MTHRCNKRPTYSLEEQQRIVDAVENYQRESGGVSAGAACASLGISHNRYKYALKLCNEHKREIGEMMPLEKAARVPAIDERDDDEADEQPDDADEVDDAEPPLLAMKGSDGAEGYPADAVVRVFVIEGTIEAVAELIARRWA